MSVMGMAQKKTYTDNLVVTINDESTEPQLTSIDFTDNGDGTCDFALNNFCLGSGEDVMGVGNIALNGLTLTKKSTYSTFEFNGSIEIAEGNDESVDFWMGPFLGEIPLVLKGEVNDDKLYVTIDIDMMETLEQIIYVKFGENNIGYKAYTDNLVVTINEESTEPQPTTVYFRNNGDGTCDFMLNNFCLGSGEDVMGVGNIQLKGLSISNVDGIDNFTFNGNLRITNGDDPNVDFWMGPLLDEIPLVLKGKITDDKVYVTIDIDMMESLEQIIYVELGDDNFIVAPTTYALKFVVEGTTVSSSELEAGATIVYPEVDPREGYTFAWDSEATTMPAEALTITGTYTVNSYKLTFVVDGETISETSVNYGATVEVPTVDEKTGYTFAWTDEAPETMPANDVTVNGTYTVNSYKLTFVVDGETISETTVNYGATVEVPTVDEKTGYTFAWTDEAPETMPAQDVTINGKFTVNTYKVIYLDTDGKTVLVSFDVEYGAAMPEAPEYKLPESDERYSYSFLGWEGETFETMPARDVVYTANVDIVDGISAVALQQNAVVYNLNGQRVNKVQRGNVYIINGKKMLVK